MQQPEEVLSPVERVRALKAQLKQYLKTSQEAGIQIEGSGSSLQQWSTLPDPGLGCLVELMMTSPKLPVLQTAKLMMQVYLETNDLFSHAADVHEEAGDKEIQYVMTRSQAWYFGASTALSQASPKPAEQES